MDLNRIINTEWRRFKDVNNTWKPTTPNCSKIFSKRRWEIIKKFRFSSFEKALQCSASIQDMRVLAKMDLDEVQFWKLFDCSLYNPDQGTKFVSEFCKSIQTYLCSGKKDPLDPSSPLKKLQKALFALPFNEKQNVQLLVNFTSKRGCPPPSKKVINQKVEEFKELVMEPFEVSSRVLSEFSEAVSSLIEEIPKKKRDDFMRNYSSHFSIRSSGSLLVPLIEGGRVAEIMNEVRPFLANCPEEDEHYFPEGANFCCPKGVPRWQTFGLHPTDRQELNEFMTKLQCQNLSFGDPIKIPAGMENEMKYFTVPDGLLDEHPYRLGIGYLFGKQLLLYSIWFKEPRPVLVRVHPLGENGGKVRTITMGGWKNIILQQYIAHIMADFLKLHPRLKTIFTQDNHAWTFQWLVHSDYKSNRFDDQKFQFYSSDFSSATDTIAKALSRKLLEGLLDSMNPYYHFKFVFEEAIDLATGEKIIQFGKKDSTDYDLIPHHRGIFMGEPLAKIVLTLWMHCIDKVALKRRGYESQPKWWNFFAPGDDHIAIGPDDYIDELIRVSQESGALLNPERTFRTRTGSLKICEKWFFVPYFASLRHCSPKEIAESTDIYNISAWVDSIPVKIFSGKPEAESADNSYIGRGRLLGKSLRWIHPAVYSFDEKVKIRKWFFLRAISDLPPEKSSLYWQFMLPKEVYGLDLWLNEDDLLKIYHNINICMRSLIYGLLKKDEDCRKLLDRYYRSKSFRGFSIDEGLSEIIDLMSYRLMRDFQVVSDTKSIAGAVDSNRKLQTFAQSMTGATQQQIEDFFKRSLVFQTMFSNPTPHLKVRTQNRYIVFKRVWDFVRENNKFEHLEFDEFKEFVISTEKRSQDIYNVDLNELNHRSMLLPRFSWSLTGLLRKETEYKPNEFRLVRPLVKAPFDFSSLRKP